MEPSLRANPSTIAHAEEVFILSLMVTLVALTIHFLVRSPDRASGQTRGSAWEMAQQEEQELLNALKKTMRECIDYSLSGESVEYCDCVHEKSVSV